MKTLKIHNLDTGKTETITWKKVIKMVNQILSFCEACGDEEFVDWVVSAIANNEPMDEEEWEETK